MHIKIHFEIVFCLYNFLFQIHAYDTSKGRRGNIVPGFPKRLGSMFQVDKTDQRSMKLPSKLDSVYYSYSDGTVYFFKLSKYWKLVGTSHINKNGNNKVAGPWYINTKWNDICDVDIWFSPLVCFPVPQPL